VLPSCSEGTPLALIEAQIAGRPAVVTDVGDSARWVIEGETGFVADAATAASFGRALARAWDRRADWRAIGERAHTAAAKRIDRNPGLTLLNHIGAVCGFPTGS
jgi:glycosyltransferase involved in cell wall biosynthesis